MKLHRLPYHVLRGHSAAVTNVTLSLDLDVCVTCSKDCSIIVHSLSNGHYIRTIYHPRQQEIRFASVTNSGYVTYFSPSDRSLYVCNVNGLFVTCTKVDDVLNGLVFSQDEKYVISYGSVLTVFKFPRYFHSDIFDIFDI